MHFAPEAIQAGVSGGLTVTVSLVALRWLITLASGRLDKREAHIDGATQRLIDGMAAQVDALQARLTLVSERLDKVEDELRQCERKHAEAEAEVMRLKATLQGYGDARDKAALIVAAEKRESKR